MKIKFWTIAALLTTSAWGQITKDQLYEMTEKQLDETIIVSILEKNCVDFELDGQMVVELSTRLSPEVLRTVVDCIRARESTSKSESNQNEDLSPNSYPTDQRPVPQEFFREKTFEIPSYITIGLSSNKSSYSASELELRIVSAGGADPLEIRYRYSGPSDPKTEIRCYKKQGPDLLEPGEYLAYLYVVSKRKTGIMGKRSVRSDLHKFRVEFQGPGPIALEYTSREEKTFRAKKAVSIKVHGPLLFFGEEHMSVDGQKSLDDLLTLAGN